MTKRHILRVSLCFALAMLTITCGPSGMEVVGDAMVDAAHEMRDAADEVRDAAIAARDTSIDALEDTGEALSDVASPPDAHAQECATCTTGGAGRSMSADTDPAQSASGSLRMSPGEAAREIAVGPFYLTDLHAIINDVSGRTGTSVLVFRLPEAMFCDDYRPYTDVGPLEFLGAARSGTAEQIHGARLFVPAGQRLCIAGGDPGSGNSARASWSGFRPYE